MAEKQANYFVLFGPPGAGKGTQAKKVSQAFDLPIVATGEIFREHLTKHTPLGEQIEAYMADGRLVPDEVTIRLVRETLADAEYARGVILDGFPRTVTQAEALIEIVEGLGGRLQVLFIRAPDEVLAERLTGRLACRKCGKVYHKTFNPPPQECEAGGAHDLYQREDDKQEIVSNRIRVYNRQTMPVIEFFEGQGYLTVVDGTLGIEEVGTSILEALEQGQPPG